MAPGAIRLSSEPDTRRWLAALVKTRSWSDLKRVTLRSLRVEGLPLRVRPAFIGLTTGTLAVLALLGFHPTLAAHISPPVPFSDKLLHFVCFLLASAQFYAIWVVDEGRRDWLWRWWPEGISVLVCLLFGSVGSEFVQALLPYKTFQYGDVIANIIGSTLGIFLARSLTLSHRRHVALQRLYQPLDLTALDDSDDGESEPGEAPPPNGEIGEGVGRAEAALTATRSGKKVRIEENPWDDGEGEIFGLGDSDDEEAHAQNSKRTI